MPIFELISNAYQLFRKHIWLFTGYAAWLLAPFAAFVLLSFAPDHWIVTAGIILASVFEMFLAIWISLIFMRLTDTLVKKKPLNTQKVQQETLGLIRSSVRVMFLQLIIFLGGLILFVIPGLIFAVWYAFSQQSLVLDGEKDMNALAASKTLVTGRFFSVVWRLLGGPLLIAFTYSLLVGGAITLVAMVAGVDPASVYEGDTIPIWAQMLEMIGELFFFPLIAIYLTLLYLHLKKTLPSPRLEKDPELA